MAQRINIDFKIPPQLRFKNKSQTATYGEFKFYLWWLSNHSRKHTTVKRVAKVIELLDVKEGRRVLEEGCGWGYASMLLARMGCEVIGIDIDKTPLDVAKKIAVYNDIKVNFVRNDVKDVSFGNEIFDAIVQMETIEHIGNDWPNSIKEISRLLKNGGEAVISTPNINGLAQIVKTTLTRFKYFQKKLGQEKFIHPKLIKEELAKNNLKLIKEKNILLAVPFLPDWLFPLNLIIEYVVECAPFLRGIATTSIFYCRKKLY